MNKQITEDYVSYEIAKLLKEKGFTQFTNMGYMEGVLTNVSVFQVEHNPDRFEAYAYTHQMTLKWLREVHNIFIDIMTYTTGSKIQFRWVGYDKGRLFSQEEGKIIYFDTHEQAVEAALDYVLKNLI